MAKYDRTIFEAAAILVYGINKISGNAPFSFDRRTMRFKTSKAHLIYPGCLTFLYIILHIHYYNTTLLNGSTMHRTLIICRYLVVAIAFIMNCINYQRLVQHMNDGRDLLVSIGRAQRIDSRHKYARTAIEVTFYFFAGGFLTMSGSYGLFNANNINVKPTLGFTTVAMILRLFSYLMQGATVNAFYVMMWLMRFYFERIADNIDDIMLDVVEATERPHTMDTKYTRMLRNAQLCDRMDTLAEAHVQLVQVCRRYNELMGVQLLTGTGFMFLVLVTQVCVCLFEDQRRLFECYVLSCCFS